MLLLPIIIFAVAVIMVVPSGNTIAYFNAVQIDSDRWKSREGREFKPRVMQMVVDKKRGISSIITCEKKAQTYIVVWTM